MCSSDLQSMRAYVAQAANGRDAFELHQEKPLDIEAQQALALASKLVTDDSNATMAPYVQQISQLTQKVAQMQQAQQQSMMMADPTAQVILKTQMAETERKTKEMQTKMQVEQSRDQQEYQLKLAELQRQVAELQTKYSTQTNLDNQRNATDIALANINNAAKERVALINAQAGFDQVQAQLEADQNLSAMEAINAANQDIRQHGLAVQQQAFDQRAQAVQHAIETEKAQQQHQQQLEQSAQQHAQTLQQADEQHQQQMMQQAAMQQQQPPAEEQQ